MPQTLKEQLDAAIARAEAQAEDDPDAYRGSEWWQLSDAEEAVFKIDRNRWPRMMQVFHCYEGFKRFTDSPEWDEHRVALSRFLNEAASLSPDMAIRLKKAFGASMEDLMRMQNNYDIAIAISREADIRVARYVPKDAPHNAQPELF